METSSQSRAGLPWPLLIGIVGALVALGVWRWVQSGKPKPLARGPAPATGPAGPVVMAAQQTLDAGGAVNAIAISRDGLWEAWATSAGVTARRVDGSGRAITFRPTGASPQATAVCFADAQTLLALFGDAVYVCTLSSGGSVVAKRFTGARPTCIATTNRAEHVVMVSGLSDGSVEIEPMQVQGGLVLSAGAAKRVQEHKGAVRAIAVSPDGKFIASTGDDGQLRVIYTSDGEYVTALLIDPGGDTNDAGRCLAFSADGQFVAAGTKRGASVWTTENWSARHRLARHEQAVTALAFADAATLVTGAADGMVLWKLSNGEPAGRIEQGHGGLDALAISWDGASLISSGKDQKVRRWDWRRAVEAAR